MKFFRYQQQQHQLPPEGNYVATVESWTEGKIVNTAVGPTPSARFTFDIGNDKKVTQSMLVFSGPTSLVEKLVNATIGEEEEEVEFEDLIGQTCGIEIRHNQVGEKTYANVVDIFPESELGPELEEDNWQDDMDGM